MSDVYIFISWPMANGTATMIKTPSLAAHHSRERVSSDRIRTHFEEKIRLYTVTFGFEVRSIHHNTVQTHHDLNFCSLHPRSTPPAPRITNPKYSASKTECASVRQGWWLIPASRWRFMASERSELSKIRHGRFVFGGDVVIHLFLGLENVAHQLCHPRSSKGRGNLQANNQSASMPSCCSGSEAEPSTTRVWPMVEMHRGRRGYSRWFKRAPLRPT